MKEYIKAKITRYIQTLSIPPSLQYMSKYLPNKEKLLINTEVKQITNNPYILNLVVTSALVKVLSSIKRDETDEYDKVYLIIQELNSKRDLTETDKRRRNDAHDILLEVKNNISKLDNKINEHEKQLTRDQEAVKNFIGLSKPKYNLIIKKK